MMQVKVYLDPEKGKYGINDINDLPLVMPVFSNESNVRKYIHEMEWVINNDDLKERYNNLMITIRSKAENFMFEFKTPPNCVILSEYSYNTAQLFNNLMIKVDDREVPTILGMQVMVDKGNWKPRVLVGFLE